MIVIAVVALLLALVMMVTNVEGQISVHPENPHYFLFQGKPLITIGSTEHYGAVLNLDFDFDTYLDTIAKEGMGMTRTW